MVELASSSAAAGTPPAASDAKPATPTSASSGTPTQDHRLSHGVFGAFMATPAELSLEPFLSDGSFISMVVDSGATDNYVDPVLTPGLRAYMRDVEELRVPHTIVAAGLNLLQGVATRLSVAPSQTTVATTGSSPFASLWYRGWAPTSSP